MSTARSLTGGMANEQWDFDVSHLLAKHQRSAVPD